MGYSGHSFDPEKVDLYFEERCRRCRYKDGVAVDYSEEQATGYCQSRR